jgi:hypothetical protein
VLLGRQCWTFIVPGFGFGLGFFFGTRAEICQRNRRVIITIRSSACSTAARLIVGSRRLAHAVSEMKSNSTGGTFMKYLLMMIIALAAIGTATATSPRTDCCGGAKCCCNGHCCAK